MSSLTPKRGFLADLFKTVGNDAWDLARVSGAWGIISYGALVAAVFIRGVQPIDFTAVGAGYAAVYAAVAGFVYAKDSARTAAVSQVAKDATAGVVAEAVADSVGANP